MNLKTTALFLLLTVATLPGQAADPPAPAAPPAWFLAHIEFLTQGRWITNNEDYKSDNEPFDEYGMEYEAGLGGQRVRGRLFGLVDGKEVATFWEFLTVWHPAENRVLAFQFGADGTYATGTVVATGEHTHRTEQTFWRPDGSSWRSGHENEEASDGSFITRSFDIEADGSWTAKRVYTWRVGNQST